MTPVFSPSIPVDSSTFAPSPPEGVRITPGIEGGRNAADHVELKYRHASRPDMADHHEHERYREFADERITSPMQPYTSGQVLTGALVALVGVLVAFGLPLLLA